MRLLVRIRNAWWSLFRRGDLEHELEEELRYHLERQREFDQSRGLTPSETDLDIRRAMLGIDARKEECREMRSAEWIDVLHRDLKFALRQLRKSPGFTAIAVLTLALGLSSAVAIFAYVDVALLKPLPYPNPATLVSVTERNSMFPRSDISYFDYVDWKRMNTVLQSFDVYTGSGFLIDTPDGVRPVAAERVSDGFFDTLGVHPQLGRTFRPGEDQVPPASVVLTHGAWQRRFGGSRDVIGQKMILSGKAYEIIGVLPENFHFALRGGGSAEVWTTIDKEANCLKRRSCHNLDAVGRLKDGVTVQAALANLSAIAAELERQYPDSNRGQGAAVAPLWNVIVGDVRPILLVLLGGAALLLMIACVNVVSLLLVRAENRRRELAIRGALGASAGRLISQFATEGLLLMLAGGSVALLLASAAIPALLKLIPENVLSEMPYLAGLELNPRSIGFAMVVSLVAAVIFSAIPAAHYFLSNTTAGLAEGSRGSAGLAWRRLGSRLVVVEFACAMVLLTGAGLLGKGLFQLLGVNLGFQPDHLATVSVMARGPQYEKPEQQVNFGRTVIARVQALPGITGASIATTLPVSFNGNTNWIRFVGKPYNGEHNEVNAREVSADHFKVIGAKLISGRFFTDSDDASKPKVVVVNQALVRKYFGDENPIGKQIGDNKLTPSSINEIVGVVEDVREGNLSSDIWPAVYTPFNQDSSTSFSLIVRSTGPPESVLPLLGPVIREVDPKAAVADEQTFPGRIERSQVAYLHRSATWLVAAFAAVALILGVIGLYGVVAYSVSQRTREIGVRMALGAEPARVRQLIMRESTALVGAATVLGICGAIAAGMLLEGLFFGVRSWDPAMLALTTLVLVGAALIASLVPAWRAARVNPVEALRAE